MEQGIETYKWRDRRLSSDRTEQAIEYKMINMTEDDLNTAYSHCKQMLYNNDTKSLGRFLVLDLVSEQLEYCGAELALRWFKSLKDNKGNPLYSNDSLIIDLRSWQALISNYDPNFNYKLKDLGVEIHPDYRNISVAALQKACRDSLGILDYSKISYSFIYRLGIYFTPTELSNHTSENTLQEKFEMLKYQLGLSEDVKLYANPAGLTEEEFKEIIKLKKSSKYQKKKYSDLTDTQLEIFKKKILFSFEDETMFQINIWKTLMTQIEEVANYKHFKLNK